MPVAMHKWLGDFIIALASDKEYDFLNAPDFWTKTERFFRNNRYTSEEDKLKKKGRTGKTGTGKTGRTSSGSFSGSFSGSASGFGGSVLGGGY